MPLDLGRTAPRASQLEVTVDLLAASPQQIQTLIDGESDPAVLRHLVDLQRAALDEDVEGAVDAVGALSDLLVLERGLA